MTDKKDKPDDTAEKFTGSPEQKIPDLEAEDKQDHQEEQAEKEAHPDK